MIVIGGKEGALVSEKCEIIQSEVICTGQAPALEQYQFYPELFMVSESFCKN